MSFGPSQNKEILNQRWTVVTLNELWMLIKENNDPPKKDIPEILITKFSFSEKAVIFKAAQGAIKIHVIKDMSSKSHGTNQALIYKAGIVSKADGSIKWMTEKFTNTIEAEEILKNAKTGDF